MGKFGVEYYTFKGRAAEKFDFWWSHDGWTKFLPKESNSQSTKPYHNAKADIITPIMGEAMTKSLDTAPTDKPFCLSVSFNVPHGSQTTTMFTDYPEWHPMTRPANENPKLKGHSFYDSLYRDLNFPLPDDAFTDPYRFIPKSVMDQDRGRIRTYDYDYDRNTCREHHIRYYQTISGVDDVIGGLLSELKQRGLADNTVILFSSDHGLLMGEYGMGGKALLYDVSSKTPCFVHDPHTPKDQRGRQLDHLVSSLDYPRTILDYAGIEGSEYMEGRSLRPLFKGRKQAWRSELFLESLFTLRDTPFQEEIQTPRWKYIRMFDGVENFRESDVDFRDRQPDFEMLFDFQADRTEYHNLTGDPQHNAILAKLQKKTTSQSTSSNQRREAFTQQFPSKVRVAKVK